MGAEKLRENYLYSLKEYLEIEPTLMEKYEFRNGEIVAMAGGTLNHSLISNNASSELRNSLKGSGCLTFNSDLKVYIESHNHSVFPDAMVICDKAEMLESRNDILLNPMLIIEVLSPSTELYDRGDKFMKYRTLGSFKEYVLISTDKYMVETFYRESANYWVMRTAQGLDGTVHLFSINKTISLKDIYENVEI